MARVPYHLPFVDQRVPTEESRPLAYGGFKYECRIVEQPQPRLAPVVLVGGAFQDRFALRRYETQLHPHATVVTVDLPGSGTADELPAEYGLEFLAGALHHTIGALGRGPCHVAAVSYGGLVSYVLGRRHPESVRRLLLCGTANRLSESTATRAQRTVDLLRAGHTASFVDAALELFLCQDHGRTVQRREAVTRMVRLQLRGLTPDARQKYLRNVDRLLASEAQLTGSPPAVPMLFVTGEHDTLSPPAMCRDTAADCPDAKFCAIRDADHLMPLERPAELADLMLRFFGGEPLTGLPYLLPGG